MTKLQRPGMHCIRIGIIISITTILIIQTTATGIPTNSYKTIETILDPQTLSSIVSDIDQYSSSFNVSSGGGGSHDNSHHGWGWSEGVVDQPQQNHDNQQEWVDPSGVVNDEGAVHSHGNVGDDGLNTYENSVTVETSGLKLALILVSLWYIFLVLMMGSTGGIGSIGNTCSNIPMHSDDHNVEPTFVNADYFPQGQPHPPQIMQMFMSMIGGHGHAHSHHSSEESGESKGHGHTPTFPLGPPPSPQLLSTINMASNLCSPTSFFYGQNKGYMGATMSLKDGLMRTANYGPNNNDRMMNLLSVAMGIRPMVNSKMWYTALAHAWYGMSGSGGGMPMGVVDAMPDLFIPNLIKDDDDEDSSEEEKCHPVTSKTGHDNGLENKFWYFREDIQTNAHHWYWHLQWPLMTRTQGMKKMLMDRRGELFYYTHRGMLQRYNLERHSAHLPPAAPLDLHHVPLLITPGYNPHLREAHSKNFFTPRPHVIELASVDHRGNPRDNVTIPLGAWFDREGKLWLAVKGRVFKGPLGLPIPVNIDNLGNTAEAVDISVNPRYYGMDGWHNDGHRLLGGVVDPRWEKMLPPGPMSDPATAMRDPIFYRFHTNVNHLFEAHKASLPAYSEADLGFSGIFVKGVGLRVVGGGKKKKKQKKLNHVSTFFTTRKFPLHMGLTFNETSGGGGGGKKGGVVEICAESLDHEEFVWEIGVHRSPCIKDPRVTVRLFLAPTFDTSGKRRLTIHEQRELFVHMDVFTAEIPPGPSIITRSSLSSALTTPFPQTLLQLNSGNPATPPNNCGCGWPHHLLLPKGSKSGTKYTVVAMITPGNDLRPLPPHDPCSKAWLFCGVRNGYYPDKRPMGFPFDRPIGGRTRGCGGWDYGSVWWRVCRGLGKGGGVVGVKWVEEWADGLGNIGVGGVVVGHKGK